MCSRMENEYLAQLLAATGFPVAYRAFRTRQDPPYICYVYVYDTQFFADDEMYYSAGHYQVELYTAAKDPAAEARVEAALEGLCWEKSEEYLQDEKVYQILYEIEV